MKHPSALTEREVNKLASKPGRHAVGFGVYLQVTNEHAQSWVFRYDRLGLKGMIGLGSRNEVSLLKAREAGQRYRAQLREGVDPLGAKRFAKASADVAKAKAVTFKECADRYIAAHEAAWKNAVHRKQWTSTLDAYVFPVFGALPVAAIDTALVTTALEPIWAAKPETAGRVRGRIESILDWAKARGFRDGENPARWRGHLDKLLPNRRKVRKVKHHAALPYPDMPAFMAALRAREGLGARALELAILTAGRTGEVIGARWPEIDLAGKVWALPGERMKSGAPHRVPLSDPALSLLAALPRSGEFVFPGARGGKPLSNMALLETLRRMERGDLTAHGFRSTFRDWAAETTSYPNEVVEMALAHAIGDAVEAAYRRGDLFEKRRQLMADWAAFCGSPKQSAKPGIAASGKKGAR